VRLDIIDKIVDPHQRALLQSELNNELYKMWAAMESLPPSYKAALPHHDIALLRREFDGKYSEVL
jgi:hypothetical protein